MMTLRRRSAFTLVELLVVIGIITILIAILLPTIRAARMAARNTVCSSRLSQLAAACTMYLDEQHTYPPAAVIPMQGEAIPNLPTLALLNQLRRYLAYPEIAESASLGDVPAIVQCPFAQDMEGLFRGPLPLPGGGVIATGYQYIASLGDPPDVHGLVIPPRHCPGVHGRTRGVLWSDTLAWYSGNGLAFFPPGAPPSWAYFHSLSAAYNGFGFTDTAGLRGQHRAYSDGSVQWIPARNLDLDLSRRDRAASYKTGPAGNFCCYYWF